MINAHPSQQLQDTTHYFIAWFAVVALLVGLATYSGRTATGIAFGIIVTAALVLIARGDIHV